MLWASDIPRCTVAEGAGKTDVTVVAGALDGRRAPAPPPRSWAARPEADVALFCIRMDPGATWTLPPATRAATVRTLYFFAGDSVRVDGESVSTHSAITVACDRPLRLEAGARECEILLMQGVPLAEPVVQYGPFVMNTRAEIERAMADYRRTGFGGWPWPSDDPVHERGADRFAKHADGRVERGR
jgi:redox-sensitive bicupin YhaK (pirin superfamily)